MVEILFQRPQSCTEYISNFFFNPDSRSLRFIISDQQTERTIAQRLVLPFVMIASLHSSRFSSATALRFDADTVDHASERSRRFDRAAIVEHVEGLPQFVDLLIVLRLIEVSGDRFSQFRPIHEASQGPWLSILDKVPVDSFHDVDGAKGGDSRVVLWGFSLFEDQECVSVNSCLWWRSRSDVRCQMSPTNTLTRNIHHQPMKHLGLILDRSISGGHIGINHDEGVEKPILHVRHGNGQRLVANLGRRIFFPLRLFIQNIITLVSDLDYIFWRFVHQLINEPDLLVHVGAKKEKGLLFFGSLGLLAFRI